MDKNWNIAVAIPGLLLLGVMTVFLGYLAFRPVAAPVVNVPEQKIVVEYPTQAPPVAQSAATEAPAATETPTAPTSEVNSSCPTTEEAKTLTGVDVQRLGTESCAWVWRGVSPATTTATCPSGFVCTWDVVNDIVVVHLGVNQTAEIRAGTWRYIAAYPVNDVAHDICALYTKEKAFGLSEVPSFQVRFQPVSDGTTGPINPQSCP